MDGVWFVALHIGRRTKTKTLYRLIGLQFLHLLACHCSTQLGNSDDLLRANNKPTFKANDWQEGKKVSLRQCV